MSSIVAGNDPPDRLIVPRAGLLAPPRVSCTEINCDSALTLVATLLGPLPSVTLSNTSSGVPGERTISLKFSSFGSEASDTSTEIRSPTPPPSIALTVNGERSPSGANASAEALGSSRTVDSSVAPIRTT